VHATSNQQNCAEPRRGRFPIAALLAWAVLALAVPRLVQQLNVFVVLGFPLGFLMAAQGSLFGFLIIAVLSARRQDRIAGTGDK